MNTLDRDGPTASSKQSAEWKNLPERGTLRALQLIYWIVVRMGRRTGRALLYPITLYYLLRATQQRRASRDFLTRILGHDPGWSGVFRHIHCFAATILDRVFFLEGDIGRFDISIHNGPLVLDQAASGEGCILLGSHLGSFEVLRAVGVTGGGLRIKVIMNIDHNASMTRFTNQLNREMASTIIATRGIDTLLRAQDDLENGYMIGMLGDRVTADDQTVTCRFFGEPAAFPTGPMIAASLAQCPVLLAFGIYRGGNRYDVYFEKLADSIPSGIRRRPNELRSWCQAYADRLQHYTQLAPYNWFNFFDFWANPGGRLT